MVWKIGPEWVAQQAKKVLASTRICGERSASAGLMPSPPPAEPSLADGLSAEAACAGGRRTKRAPGTSNAQAKTAIKSCAERQSYRAVNQLAKGETVIGATPIPADTRETARLRCLSNHPVTGAIAGAN